MENKNYTIGIMDEEKKERNRIMNFFEERFNVVAIDTFTSIEDMIDLIKSEAIHALAIDYKLTEHGDKFKKNGDFIFKMLSETLKGFPAFILTNDSKAARTKSKSINSFFIVDKAQTYLELGKGKTDFLKEIESNIKLYQAAILANEKKLKKLEVQKQKGTLTSKQENEYLTLINELSKQTTGVSAIPLKYFSKSTDAKLNKIIAKTDSIIKQFSKK